MNEDRPRESAEAVAEAMSDGINRLVWLIHNDVSDDDTKDDVRRLIGALDTLKSSATIMTSFKPSQELFDDLHDIRKHLESRYLAPDERIVVLRRACAALGHPTLL